MGKHANSEVYRQLSQREPELEYGDEVEFAEYVEAPLDTEQRGEMTC